MEIKTFIEKAIEGGWKQDRAIVGELDLRDGYEGMKTIMQSTDRMFLDPLAWKALGKAEGNICGDCEGNGCEYCDYNGYTPPLHLYVPDVMHSMIDALAGGKSIEEFLETL